MATYYVYDETGPVSSGQRTRRAAEAIARFIRRSCKLSTRVLSRCDHPYPGMPDGPDSERHMGLHYRAVAIFPLKGSQS